MTSSNHDASLRYKDFILSIKCARAKEREREKEREIKGGEKRRKRRKRGGAESGEITRNFRNM